jgi:hypothetical protein
MTSTVDVKDDSRSRPIQKAKVNILPAAYYVFFENKSLLLMCGTCQIEIILGKTDMFDKWMAAGSATAEEWEAVEAEEQN